jgi:hypothetical protein
MNNNQFNASIAKTDRYMYIELSNLFLVIGSILLISFTVHVLSIVQKNYDLNEKTRLIQSEIRRATITKQHLLSIDSKGNGEIAMIIDNTPPFMTESGYQSLINLREGKTISLMAVPRKFSKFIKWTGSSVCEGRTDSEITFEIEENTDCHAIFIN